MKGLGILILIVVFFWLVWPAISRWLKRKALQRAEDYMRASMGMPPRDKKNKARDKFNSYSSSRGSYSGNKRRNPFGADRYSNEPIIPKEYAEDVEFTETKDFSETEHFRHDTSTGETYHESQISDAEFIEIKKSRSK